MPSSSVKKKGSSRVEDAIEQKLRKKKERDDKLSQDRLEAKIKKKQETSYTYNNHDDDDDEEEEKLEEGMYLDRSSNSSRDGSSKKKKKSKKSTSSTGAEAAATSSDGLPLFTKGGGDVRNRPPPSLADLEKSRQTAIDPFRAAEEEREKNKKKVNSRFADFHETGQWGGLSKWEKYGICLLTLGAIGVAIFLGIRFGGGGDKSDEIGQNESQTKSPTLSPTVAPTFAPTLAGYRLTTGLSMMKQISPSIALPNNPEALIGAKNRAGSTPQMLAAEFILYDDAQMLSVRDPAFLERYALAVFFYANGGCSGEWITSTNWMDPVNATYHCGQAGGSGRWHGVFCNLQGRVT